MIEAIPGSIPRAALVTGGETERGMALAHAFADAGFAVALQCHAPLIADPPKGTTVIAADLTVERRLAALVPRAMASVGPLGVLVNAAGPRAEDTWEEPARAVWDAQFEANLRAPFVLIQQFAQSLPDEQEGVVINLLDPDLDPRALSHTLANAAAWALTQAMALALAPRIRVNGIKARSGPDAVARAAIAILALPSMTGQMMMPDGVAGVSSSTPLSAPRGGEAG